ncbi:MAG: methyltransferase domain-containing protein [Anaerolineales bacterium]|nr:methyltransferase domain-containing protein [Anaerolineales bacterium]
MKAAAFDSLAAEYDSSFTRTRLGRQLREIVWEQFNGKILSGKYVLELNCGTGEDAIWLAKQRCKVVATDISSSMIDIASSKVEASGLGGMVDFHFLDLAKPSLELNNEKFDYVLSNFGGLNCVQDLNPISSYLADHVKSSGQIVLVLMGKWCLWEIIWHGLHGDGEIAFRRLRKTGATAKIGSNDLHVWYPAVRDVKCQFERFFKIKKITGLGVFLPPTYLEKFIEKHPSLWSLLTWLEHKFANLFPFKYFADHLIFEFERL